MAHRLLRDPDADGWERADFPIVCETCLGPNPYVRMQRMEFGGECHISGRPYTKFRWRPGNDARYKGTIICQEVAKAKNVCQVCLLDLDYNLPVQVRDQAMGLEDEQLPDSDVGKEFALERMSNEGELGAAYERAKATETIMRLQRTTPYYQRNRAPVCSFFVKGECKRGAECPYRHEMPSTGDLAKQNIKDRYFGVNDPVARKMLNRSDNSPPIEPPDDPTITTLFVGGIQPEVTEEDLQSTFSLHGEISRIKIIETRNCAFVTFKERKDAETAAEKLHNKLVINGIRLKLMWGRPQERRPEQLVGADGVPVPGGMVPPHVQRQMGGAAPFPPSGANFFNLRGTGGASAYPSMDPQQAGTRVPAHGEQAAKRKGDGGEDPLAKRQHPGMPPYMPPPMGYGAMGFPPRGPPLRPFPPGSGMYGPPGAGMGSPPGWRPPPQAPSGVQPSQAQPSAQQAAAGAQ